MTTFTYPDPARIPWVLLKTRQGGDGAVALFYGRTGTGFQQRPWHGEGTWESGVPVVLNEPNDLTITHWLPQGEYEVKT